MSHGYRCFHQQSARDGGSWGETHAVVLILERDKLRQRLNEGWELTGQTKGTTVAVSKGLPAAPHALAHVKYSEASASLPGVRHGDLETSLFQDPYKCRKQDPSFS